MAMHRVERLIGDRPLIIETGKLAKQAAGAVTVRYGDTMVLATVVCAEAKRDTDFFPLTVEYREKFYAAGKVPGGRFMKREGRPSRKEILTSRMCDRPLRPLFPKGFREEVMVHLLRRARHLVHPLPRPHRLCPSRPHRRPIPHQPHLQAGAGRRP